MLRLVVGTLRHAWKVALPFLVAPFLVLVSLYQSVKDFVLNRGARLKRKESWVLPKMLKKSLVTRDDIQITYHILEPGEHKKTIVFARGLGVNNIASILPVIHVLGYEQYQYIMWDYRGLFSSGSPSVRRRLAIPEHAEDLKQILDLEQISSVDLMIGHSMGVQISLEFCCLYSKIVRRLLLINGTHGQVFQTAFQPIFRVPFVNRFLCYGLEVLSDTNKDSIKMLHFYLRVVGYVPVFLYTCLFGSSFLKEKLGITYLNDFLDDYFGDVYKDETHMRNYVRLFQELDAHSVFHLLHTIHQPTLVISGLFDTFTPAYQGIEIAERLQNSTHVMCWFASHLAPLESPNAVMDAVSHFESRTSLRF